MRQKKPIKTDNQPKELDFSDLDNWGQEPYLGEHPRPQYENEGEPEHYSFWGQKERLDFF